MSNDPVPDHEYDRNEVAEIFRRAAAQSHSAAGAPGEKGLSLRELEAIALEVGLSPLQVRDAALALSEQAHSGGSGDRMRVATAVPGELTEETWSQLADLVLSMIGPAELHRDAGVLTVRAEKADLGALMIKVRSGANTVDVSLWAERSTTRNNGIIGGTILGAIAGSLLAIGIEPSSLLEFLAVTGVTAATGAGVGLAVWKETGRRWQRRVAAAQERLVQRVVGLVGHSSTASQSLSDENSAE